MSIRRFFYIPIEYIEYARLILKEIYRFDIEKQVDIPSSQLSILTVSGNLSKFQCLVHSLPDWIILIQ